MPAVGRVQAACGSWILCCHAWTAVITNVTAVLDVLVFHGADSIVPVL